MSSGVGNILKAVDVMRRKLSASPRESSWPRADAKGLPLTSRHADSEKESQGGVQVPVPGCVLTPLLATSGLSRRLCSDRACSMRGPRLSQPLPAWSLSLLLWCCGGDILSSLLSLLAAYTANPAGRLCMACRSECATAVASHNEVKQLRRHGLPSTVKRGVIDKCVELTARVGPAQRACCMLRRTSTWRSTRKSTSPTSRSSSSCRASSPRSWLPSASPGATTTGAGCQDCFPAPRLGTMAYMVSAS